MMLCLTVEVVEISSPSDQNITVIVDWATVLQSVSKGRSMHEAEVNVPRPAPSVFLC
jgi:hypothetical protein